jgi:molybdopterin-biosynthesis enzyme MoeA-like protein
MGRMFEPCLSAIGILAGMVCRTSGKRMSLLPGVPSAIGRLETNAGGWRGRAVQPGRYQQPCLHCVDV